MKKVQNNRHNMHLSIKSVLNQNEVKLITIPGYTALKDKLDNSIAKEQELEIDQHVHKTYTAAAKNNARNKVCEYTLDLASKVSALALFAGDFSLLERSKLTATYVKRISDNLLDSTITNVITYAGDNLEALEGYDVTAETLAEGIALSDAFTAERRQLAQNKIHLKTLTQLLEKQLRATLGIIHFMDALIATRRLKDPELYSLYWRARAKLNSACSKVSVKGRIFVAETGVGLPAAILTVETAPSDKTPDTGTKRVKKIRIRSANGRFQFRLQTTGAYIFKVTYAGCNPEEFTVYFNEGVLTHVELPMTRIGE